MHKSIIIGSLLSSFAIAPAVADNSPAATDIEIYASVYSTNSWKEHNFDEPGMYKFRTDRYNRELVYQDPDIDASGGGVMTDDFYFCTSELNFGSWIDVTHYVINPDTWKTVTSLREGNLNAVASDMTYDPITSKIYGCFNGDNEGDQMVFGTLDESTGERYRIADIEIPWIACSVDKGGNLYAVDMAGNLLSVNKTNGVTTTLGNLGFSASNRSTGAIDPRSGIFYVVVTNSVENPDETANYMLNDSRLYAVDIQTVKATFLYEFEDGEALGGMFIPGSIAEDGAPAAVSDLAVDFPEGALSGTVSFTVPATTFDGSAATGDVSYLVRANGNLLAEGVASYGSHVEAPASISEAAMYEVEIFLSNKVGRGPKTKLTMWLGPDTPANLSGVTATYKDGLFNIDWNAPVESEHGGYFDPAKVRYIVTRQPDGVVVAQNLSATSYADAVAVPEDIVFYSYEVTLVYDGTRFMPVRSNEWPLGAVKLPYKATFAEDNSLDHFTVIDVDGDRIEWYREWEFYIESTDELVPAALYPYSSETDADDWLITPPVNLTAGKTYEVSYKALTDYEGYEPLLAIYCGTAPNQAAMLNKIMDPTAITSLLPEEHKVKFSVTEDGSYYLGFHACSEPYRSAIALTEIGIAESQPRHDVAVEKLDVPAEILPNNHAVITVKVANLAKEAAHDISVILSRDNNEIDRRELSVLEANSSVDVAFSEMLTPFHNAEPVYVATVVYALDENDSNNTLTASASLKLSQGNTVNDLSGIRNSDGDVVLAWSDPASVSRAVAGAVTESFENYESFSIDGAGEWKFVSLDDTPANEMELASLPHLGTGEDIAYMVLDASGIDESFKPYSGNKCLMAVWNDEYNDDWAISPLLSGHAQTVTFMARSYDDYYLENLMIKYSTTDNDINSFDYLPEGGAYDEISAEWTSYSFDLPEGAKYFAIGYVSECKVAALIDDVTFMPAGGSSTPVSPLGYNIYRDGVKINGSPVVDLTYIDRPQADADLTYHVTALYDDGESKISNAFKLDSSGIDNIGADDSDTRIWVGDGRIIIESAFPYEIYSIDGRCVASGRSAQAVVNLASGVYVVKSGRFTTKAVVR